MRSRPVICNPRNAFRKPPSQAACVTREVTYSKLSLTAKLNPPALPLGRESILRGSHEPWCGVKAPHSGQTCTDVRGSRSKEAWQGAGPSRRLSGWRMASPLQHGARPVAQMISSAPCSRRGWSRESAGVGTLDVGGGPRGVWRREPGATRAGAGRQLSLTAVPSRDASSRSWSHSGAFAGGSVLCR